MCGAVLLIFFLFIFNIYSKSAYNVLGGCWQKIFFFIGLAQHLPSVLKEGGALSHAMINPHNVLGVITYSIFYILLCLVLLFIVEPGWRQRRLVLLFYCASILCSFFLLAGSGISDNAYIAAMNGNLMHFIVSPLPLIVLIPFLRWYRLTEGAS